MSIIGCHFLAWFVGVALDLVVGDPQNFPHPIRWIGSLIQFGERRLLGERRASTTCEQDASPRRRRRETLAGAVLCVGVVTTALATTFAALYGAYRLHWIVGVVAEAVLTCYLLAARSLADESMKVYRALKSSDLEGARAAVGMIVGRDVARLDASGIARATVETVSENASDGVVAPLLYSFIGGPILGFGYKGVNTLDSMIGYHNERYEYFGKASARLDDVANYIPSRVCAALMILAAYLGGKEYSGDRARRIFRRDRYNHKSPNSGQSESACAGALGVRLAGDAHYFGKLVRKPYIGDAEREIEAADIPRACRLMFVTEALAVALAAVIVAIVASCG